MPSVQRRYWSDEEKRTHVVAVETALASGALVQDACKQRGISDGSYYTWRKQFPNDAPAPTPAQPGIASMASDELAQLRAENAKMRKFIGAAMVDMFLRGEVDMSVGGNDDADHG